MIELTKEENRERFIQLAQECFSRYGLKKTTMNDIARAAKKAKSSLYYYFKSKEEIMEAIAKKEVKVLNEEINKALDKEKLAKDKLRAYILNRALAIVKTANYYNLFLDDYIENYSSLEKIRGAYEKEATKTITIILEHGVTTGEFNINTNLNNLAESFMAILKGLELKWLDDKDLPKLKKNVENLLDIMLYGIMNK